MDAVKVIGIFILMVIPFIIAKLWWWVGFWVILGVLLGIVELVSVLVSGKTISQRFWKWRKKTETSKWLVYTMLAGMILFWAYLMCHLFLGW